ncbi:MAG TPA: hypothetical protein VKR06_37265 [Ktedonosporobacter sp.]|nr:hypothetical protein [Ktedonosporobacter sp.]
MLSCLSRRAKGLEESRSCGDLETTEKGRSAGVTETTSEIGDGGTDGRPIIRRHISVTSRRNEPALL